MKKQITSCTDCHYCKNNECQHPSKSYPFKNLLQWIKTKTIPKTCPRIKELKMVIK